MLWKKEIRNGKTTKIPYQSLVIPLVPSIKKLGSSTDPSTWSTYDSLKETYFKDTPTSGDQGIGIVFENSANIIGVDFDHCVEDGKIHPDVLEFVRAANTYVEYSPSGTGLHLLFQKTEEITLLANKHHFDNHSIEIYTSGRYFTFTENEHELSKPIRQITSDDFTKLLGNLGYPWGKDKAETVLTPPVETSFTLEDSELLEKMLASKNGAKIKRLWDGDASDYNNDFSSADHALCMHLAFWSGKNAEQIERLWLSSTLGQRTKTKKRQDYRTLTVANAINATTEIYTPKQVFGKVKMGKGGEKIDYEFILTGKLGDQYPMLVHGNILRVLRKDPYFKDVLRKNDFSHLAEFKNSQGQWEIMNDDFISSTREYISEEFPWFVKMSSAMTTEAILRVASDNRVNPPRDYFTSLVWDGTPRLNSWLHHTYGTPDDELHQAIGSNWIKGLVKRVMRPGCQFDEVLALESPQGYRKSTSLRVLGAPWHVETTHSIDNKDFYLLLAQNVIVEFSEGEIMDRASVNKLKAEITKTEDQVRPPYERGMVKFSRACVFAVTTNRLELKDDTGNRRWLPVQLQKVADIDWLAEHKDQLFAEAYHRVIIGNETTHEYPDSLVDLQESRQEYNDSDELLIDYLAKFDLEKLEEGELSLQMACRAALGDVPANKLDELRVSSALRRLHFDNKSKRIGAKVVRRWIPNPKAIEMLKAIKEHNDNF